MGQQGGPAGQADYLALGDFNAACSMCGRKRKASPMVKNWQGQYRCPWHNEPRQPQDFVRNVKDIQTVPWSQPETVLFQGPSETFPIFISPSALILAQLGSNIQSEALPNFLIDENGTDLIVTEATDYTGSALVSIPGWVTVTSILWSWLSGGVGIVLTNTTGIQVFMFTANPSASGVLQVRITSMLGNETAVGTATINVTA